MDQNTATAITHLKSLQEQQQNEAFSNIEQYYEGKLWHQLTHAVLELISSNDVTIEMNYLDFYRNVVQPIEGKFNIVSLSRIVCGVGRKLLTAGDSLAAVTFVQEFVDQQKSKTTSSPASMVYLQAHVCLFQLQSNPDASVLDQVKDILMETKKLLDVADAEPLVKASSNNTRLSSGNNLPTLISGSDAALVHAAYHEASMLYRKHVGPPEAFYNEALHYLNYVGNVPGEINDAKQLAVDLSLAALTGEDIFNFGQVCNENEILNQLQNTEYSWLMELMMACAKGDMDQFIAIISTHKDQVEAQPALVARSDVIQEKITLLSLVHMVFERPPQERTLSFEDICAATKLADIKQVEPLVMRALSLGLIRGVMDEVAQEVTVHWVMARVLDDVQLKGLACRFGEWAVQTSKVGDYVGEHVVGL